MPVTTRSSRAVSTDLQLSGHNCDLAVAAIPAADLLHADPSCEAPFQLLPEDLLEGILDRLLRMGKDDSLSKPLPQLYCTNRATRIAMLNWQRREDGAAGRARIGAADIRLAMEDKDGLDALEQLTRSFPQLASLRRFQLRGTSAPERFLSQPGAKEKLASVLELELGVDWEGTKQGQPLKSRTFNAICSACPSLAALNLGNSPIQGLSSLAPLHRLSSLKELTMKTNVLRGNGSISPADLAALGSLTSLAKLSIATDKLSTLLPRLSSLTCLSDLNLESGTEALRSAVPQFSSLASLQQLTRLQWASPTRYSIEILSDVSLSAICCCTQLVSLDLPDHDEVQPQQLLLLPRLKSLVVGRVATSEPLSFARSCSLESLQLLHVPKTDAGLATLLPLCRAVKLLELPWLSKYPYNMSLGRAETAEQVSAAADRVGAAAQALAELASLSGKAVGELALNWEGGLPRCPTAAVIAALGPLQQGQRKIALFSWELDQALVEQLAETLPGLEVLSLSCCVIRLDAWQSMLRLAQLSRLELFGLQAAAAEAGQSGELLSPTEEDRDALLGYAAAVQRDLTVFFGDTGSNGPFSYEQLAARWEEAVGDRRRAAGTSGCVRIDCFRMFAVSAESDESDEL